MKHMRGYRVSMTFEGYTGADIILTPIKDIISQDTIQKHLSAGAVMIQVKHGHDFPSSVIDQRLFESLLRMSTHAAHQYQCGLLITGDYQIKGSELFINGQKARINVNSYMGAWNSWVIRGGVVYPVIKPEDMQSFIDILGQKLFVKDPFTQSPTAKPRKKFKVEKRFSKAMGLRQRARLATKEIDVHDFRHLLINIDGLTNAHINAIWAKLDQKNMTGFIAFLMAGELLNIKGVGPKTNDKVKKQLGY